MQRSLLVSTTSRENIVENKKGEKKKRLKKLNKNKVKNILWRYSENTLYK